jgi:hypothetical protein
MLRVVALALFVVPLLAAACSSVSKTPEPSSSGQMAPAVAPFRSDATSADAARAAAPPGGAGSNAASGRSTSAIAEAAVPSLDRMVVTNVTLALSVDNAVDAARLAERIADRYSGFVAGSNVRDSEGGREASVTIRVPSARLSEALADLRGIGRRVTDESRTTQDVTEEYTDVESNARNLRATEAQILALMERATKVEEVLVLQRELTGIRGQIERLEGRRRVLENRSDFATIAMKLVEPVAATSRDASTVQETAAQALAALARFAERLVSALIWVVVFLPVYGPVVAAGWWLARRGRVPATPAPASRA